MEGSSVIRGNRGGRTDGRDKRKNVQLDGSDRLSQVERGLTVFGPMPQVKTA